MIENIYGLSLGSNIKPEENIPNCIQKLSSRFKKITFSTIYETPPVGPVGDAHFWNLAAVVTTSLSADELKQEMLTLEDELGRIRDPDDKNCPRVIDIDVLPKEGYAKLAFVVFPMAEIAPDMIEDFSKKTYKSLSEQVIEDTKFFKKIDLAI